jgi:sRNA-binding protein
MTATDPASTAPAPPADATTTAGADAAAVIDAAAAPTVAGHAPSPDADAPATADAPAAAADMTPAACGARLAELFPALFAAEGPRKPLKLRIQADIQLRAPGVFSKRLLSFFFSRYTTTTAYLKALAHSPHRFDLDGNPAGDIADEHRQAAVAELARRQAIIDERRAAHRQAQRAAEPAAAARDAGQPAHDRGPRPGPRPDGPDKPRGAHPPRHDRGPDGPAARPHRTERRDDGGAGRPRSGGAPRPERAAFAGRPPQDRHHAKPHAPHAQSQQPGRTHPDAGAGAPLPDDPQRRARALLLRAWESSPLAKPNFCALKGLNVAEFDTQIELARRERAERSGGAAQRDS